MRRGASQIQKSKREFGYGHHRNAKGRSTSKINSISRTHHNGSTTSKTLNAQDFKRRSQLESRTSPVSTHHAVESSYDQRLTDKDMYMTKLANQLMGSYKKTSNLKLSEQEYRDRCISTNETTRHNLPAQKRTTSILNQLTVKD